MPWNGRHGTFDKDQPMITYIHQRDGMTYFDVSSADKSLVDTVCIHFEYNFPIFTDEYRVYDQLEEPGFTDRSVNHSDEKGYANGSLCK